jgi:hypothetical protein
MRTWPWPTVALLVVAVAASGCASAGGTTGGTAYHLATGRPAWRASMPAFVQAPPIPAAGALLIQPADPSYACALTG